MRRARAKKASPGQRTRPQVPSAPGQAAAVGTPCIVGIGASAGGLEAIEQFLGGVPESSGLAFVVVQHLDPTQAGLLPELLQRATRMRVAQVQDGIRVEPDRVYVIPPNKDLYILQGVLHLRAPSAPRGLRLPIDLFLRALADDQLEASVAVILSGMGSDGTLGLKAVKERGGIVLVQEPTTAKFDSMPRSAIDTRLADVVAPAQELAARLIALRQGAVGSAVEATSELRAQGALDRILPLIHLRLGHDFSQYRKNTLSRRVARRMALHQISDSEAYVRYLNENPLEQELLFGEFLIGVTHFFRDAATWDALRDESLPTLLAGRPKEGPLRAWVPACSTGEEAYSLAIIFKEGLEKARPKLSGASLQIFATDLDRRAIEKARKGVYPANITSDVSAERLQRFFVKEKDGQFRVNAELRAMVTLAQQDVTRDAPFTRMDIIACRNLLIYLEPELQRRLIALFHYGLRRGGVLLLGASEAITAQADLFAPVHPKLRLYRRKDSSARAEVTSVPSFPWPSLTTLAPLSGAVKPQVNLQAAADEVILRQFGPAAAVVTQKGDILHINGHTGKYLEASPGKVNWNVFAMAREGLRQAIGTAIQKASRQMRAITIRGLTVDIEDGHSHGVDLTVKPLQEPHALRGMYLVVFQAAAPGAATKGKRGRRPTAPTRLAAHAREMRQLRNELQSTSEDMQTAQEELRSANEELQSMNEELQSTNEELTTSKEELQSMNEELQSVNVEQAAKMDELSEASSDMKNLLESTQIATLFLDRSLHIRRYTEQATRFLRLIPTDVGRLITDINSDLIFPGMSTTVAEVLRTLNSQEKEITTTDGRWFSTRVMPYRTLDDVINGAVVTFMDITAAKRLEAALGSTRKRFGALLENLPDGLGLADGQGHLVPRTSALDSIANAPAEDLVGWRIVVTTGDELEREKPT